MIFIVPALLKEIRSVFRDNVPSFTPTEVVILKGVPLTGNAGTERTPSFSPDGTQVVYSWNGSNADNFDIYKKPAGDGPSVRLTTDAQEDFAPAWSPDGKTIAFLRTKGVSDDIVLIPAAGGPERKAGEVTHQVDRYGLTWKKDSQSLIVSDAPSPGTAMSLYDLSITSGEKKRITRPSRAEEGDFFPSISPGGDVVAFVRNPSGFRAEIFTLDITDEDAEPQRIASPKLPTTHPAWTSNGNQLIFAAGAAGASLLWRVPADGSRKPMPLIGLGVGEDPAVSTQGSRLVYSEKTKDRKSHPLLVVDGFR
jgi:Tol biopolymer transport system component